MKRELRFRFWLETFMAAVTSILFVVTMVWPHWVEMVFHVSLDSGNGSFERLIVAGFLVLTITLFLLARYEWRIARTAT